MSSPDNGMKWRRLKSPLRLLLAVFFVVAGILHFVKTPLYLQIMPPYLPYHLALVYISGACEIMGGIGVLIPAVRRYAGYGLIALSIAVLPANVQMAVNYIDVEGFSVAAQLLLLRLPLQGVVIFWIYWCCIRLRGNV